MKKEYLIYKLSEDLKEATRIENELFKKFDVKRGLRNEDGTGVLVGLTKIGNVVGYERIPGGGLKPIPGKLFYRATTLRIWHMPFSKRNVSALKKWRICCFQAVCPTGRNWLLSVS